MGKSAMSSSLASSVAALAASAAKEKPASKPLQPASSSATPAGKGVRAKQDSAQKENSSRPPKKVRPNKAAEAAAGEEDKTSTHILVAQPTSADQTRVMVSGLDADTEAEALEDAFRCLALVTLQTAQSIVRRFCVAQ